MIQRQLHAGVGALLTTSQAAQLLGVHPDTLRDRDRAGKFKALRHPVNGYRLCSRSSLQQLSATLNPNRLSKDHGDGQGKDNA